jgi:hypothetical protein
VGNTDFKASEDINTSGSQEMGSEVVSGRMVYQSLAQGAKLGIH